MSQTKRGGGDVPPQKASQHDVDHVGCGYMMVNDLYTDAGSLAQHLKTQGLHAWASKIEDIIEGGSTGTEIVMGLRWVAGELQRLSWLDLPTKREVDQLRATADMLLR